MTHFEPFFELSGTAPADERSSITSPSFAVMTMATGIAIGALVGSALGFGIRILGEALAHRLETLLHPVSSLPPLVGEFRSSLSAVPSAEMTEASSLPDLPYSSSPSPEGATDAGNTHIYLLSEGDLTELMATCAAGVDLDETLLSLWMNATRVNLDEMDEDTNLFEVIAAATEVDPEALHALIFTYSPDADEESA